MRATGICECRHTQRHHEEKKIGLGRYRMKCSVKDCRCREFSTGKRKI